MTRSRLDRRAPVVLVLALAGMLAACTRAPPADLASGRVVVVLQGEVAAASWRAHVVATGPDDSAAVAALGSAVQSTATAAGAAPGAVVDAVFDALVQAGRADHLVEHRGAVRARGRNAAGQPWSVDVAGGERVIIDDGSALVVAGGRAIRGGTAAAAAAAAGGAG